MASLKDDDHKSGLQTGAVSEHPKSQSRYGSTVQQQIDVASGSGKETREKKETKSKKNVTVQDASPDLKSRKNLMRPLTAEEKKLKKIN